jgi:hypothetical protein
VTKLQGRDGYRLRMGGWRVIYELHDARLELGFGSGAAGRSLLMRVETITRKGKEFAVIPVKTLRRLMEDAEMLADVKAYDSESSPGRRFGRAHSFADYGAQDAGRAGAPPVARTPQAYAGAACQEVESISGADRGD